MLSASPRVARAGRLFNNRYEQSERENHVPGDPFSSPQPGSAPASDELASKAFPHTLSDIHFRLLVDAVQDYAIFMLDPDGRVVSWNRGAQSIKGYVAGEIVGQHFSVFYTPEDVTIGKPHAELALAASEGRIEDEGWRMRKDGSRFWANVTITAIRAPDGALHGFAKVTRDMTDRLRLIELQHASALSSHVQSAREEERTRIARELHDDLGQQLVALKMDVALLDQPAEGDDGTACHAISQTIALQAQIDSIIASARRIAGGLRPPMLDDLGLGAALEWLAAEFRNRYGLVVTVQNTADQLPLSATAATAIFRVVQEALTNVTRHAEATQVRVEMRLAQNEFRLHVEDDGKGTTLDGHQSNENFGLLGMQERVRQLRGKIAFDSAPGDGFRIDVRLPIEVVKAKDDGNQDASLARRATDESFPSA
ncbi:PAS domain-containing sensor histidine kinase [Caballeronia mineralivorans]|uniref:PAS domain-containing sensor histidine kinase n=1 Tax=Caballeronia mineralivorans TaxID=2010198 RepID=UPI0007C82040|nr:PAS domain-containing sensor histidine kinase [Caballeronia mineralivorans]